MLELPSVVLMLNCCPTLSCAWDGEAPEEAGASTFTIPSATATMTRPPAPPYIEGGTHGRDRHISNRHGEWPRRILRDSKESFAALERHLACIATQRRPQHRAGAHAYDGPVAKRHVAILAGSRFYDRDRRFELRRADELQRNRRCENGDDTCGQADGVSRGDSAKHRPSLRHGDAPLQQATRDESSLPGGHRHRAS